MKLRPTARRLIPALAGLISLASCGSVHAQLGQIDLRWGFDAEENFELKSNELVLSFETPWSWQLGAGYTARLQLETGIGAVHGEGEHGVYGRIAPTLELSHPDANWSLFLSSGPSLYSEHIYGLLDLGGDFQFMSSAGISWQVAEKWRIGYRFQHTSNAHLYDLNPGLDLHVLSIARRF